jgi:hypothetical protein
MACACRYEFGRIVYCPGHAAAPDLLEALLVALPYVTDVLDNPDQLQCFKAGAVQSHEKQIRSAIRRAEGG